MQQTFLVSVQFLVGGSERVCQFLVGSLLAVFSWSSGTTGFIASVLSVRGEGMRSRLRNVQLMREFLWAKKAQFQGKIRAVVGL